MGWAHPDAVNSWLSKDKSFRLRVRCAIDAETPGLALHELVSFQEEYRHAQAGGASWGISPLHSHQQHCPFPTAPLQRVLVTKFYICLALYMSLSYPGYPTPSESWECIMKTWWLPAVFSWHFLCTNLLGNYIKSRNEIKNANFKVITYMWL